MCSSEWSLDEVRGANQETSVTAHFLGKEQWFAVQTRSRHEKLVASQLTGWGVEHWLPLIEKRRKWSDRYMTISDPLFPGYLFTSIDYASRVDVLRARGVVRIIGFDGQPSPIPCEQLNAIHAALKADLKCDPYSQYQVGDEVEVIRGSLKGYRGILVEKNGKHRLQLSVPLISQALLVEVDVADVEAI